MTWQRFEHTDPEIRRWIKTQGWELLGRSEYDAGTKIHTWRFKLRGGKSSSLGISRQILEDYPAFIVLYHLDTLNAAAAIRAKPGAGFVLVQKGQTVTLEESGDPIVPEG